MTKIFAHRGASITAAENTMPAFESAIKQNAHGIELDVHKTRDGKLIVTHDENLIRVTGQDKKIIECDYADIKKLNAANFRKDLPSTHIPLLEEVLDLLKDKNLLLNIELKNSLVLYPELEEDVVKLVEAYDMEDRVIYSSFNHYSIMKLLMMNTKSELAFLYAEGLYKPWKYAKENHAHSLHPFYPNLAIPDYMEHARKENIKVRPWTVDDPDYMKKLILLGVDGLITNDPVSALQMIDQLKNADLLL